MERPGSRALLLVAAIAAVGVVAVLLRVAGSETPRDPDAPASSIAPTSGREALASLEATADAAPTRADAPEPEARGSSSSAGDRTLVLSGRVIERRSRAALQGVELQATWGMISAERVWGSATSDAEGRYSIRLAVRAEMPKEPGEWTVRLVPGGDRFGGENVQLDTPDFRPDPSNSGTFLADRDLEADVFNAFRGRVVSDTDGTPVAGAMVALLLSNQAGLRVTTDDAGSFLLKFTLKWYGDLELLVAAPGYQARTVPALLDSTRVIELGDVFLSRGACIEGFVTTNNGSAHAAKEVTLQSKRLDEGTVMFLREGEAWAQRDGALLPMVARTPIGADGSFRICGLSPGDYVLSATYTGCVLGPNLDSVDVSAPSAGVALPLSRAVYRLHVVDAVTGSRIWSPQIRLDGAGHMCGLEGDSVIATEPGIARTGRIVEEGYNVLKCTLPALAPSEIRELEFRLEPLPQQVTPTIKVISPVGTPVKSVEIEIGGDEDLVDAQIDMRRQSYTATNGWFRLPKLVPGTYRVVVEPSREDDPAARMWLAAEVELQVREGMEPLEVRLREGGLFRATVTNSNGQRLDAYTSLVRAGQEEPLLLYWRNEANTPPPLFPGWIPRQTPVRLAKPLPAGRCTVRFAEQSCASKDVDIDIQAGATVAIDVSLEPR